VNKQGNSGFDYGYVIVAVSFLLQATGWGIFNSLGIFFKPLMDEFGWPRAQIASTITAGMLVIGTSAILQGRLSDRYGPRLTMAISGGIFGLGFVLMAGIHSIWQVYLYLSLIAGIGVSGTDAVLLSTATRWFTRKRGLMVGIVKVGTGIGMLVMPLLINYFIGEFGWRKSFVILGGICFCTYMAASQLLIRDPAALGGSAYGDGAESGLNRKVAEEGLTLQQAVRTAPFWMICGMYMAVLFCLSTILFHIVPHAIDLGVSPSGAAKVLAMIGAVSIGGRFLMGGAGDAIGNRNSLVVAFGVITAAMVWLQFADSLRMLYLFAALHGFAHGAFYALMAPLLADYCGTRDHGVILGVLIFISTIGGSTGPLIAGILFDSTGTYRTIFLLLSVLSVLGLLASFLLKPVRTR